jgi:NIMA (never in mitosis gene a)-related kinase 1/4/5
MPISRPFEGSSMKQLVTNIINKPTPQLPSQYSTELKALVNAMLAKSFRERPSINTVLATPIMREKITNILDDHVRQVRMYDV